MQTSTQYKVGQHVTSVYFGESIIEEISGKHYLVRGLDGRSMYHWTSEFDPLVAPRDAVVLTDHAGQSEVALVLAVSADAALVSFEDGSELWVALFHVTQIIGHNVPMTVYRALMTTSSIGLFMEGKIKPFYTCRKMTDAA